MAVQLGSIYGWGTKLSPTTLFFLFSCPQAISLVGLRMFMFTPYHLAIPLAVN